MARPTKYSAGIEAAICEHLRHGATRTAAAQASGIDYETLRRWMQSNAAFCGSITRAEAEAELRFTAAIARAAVGTEDRPGD